MMLSNKVNTDNINLRASIQIHPDRLGLFRQQRSRAVKAILNALLESVPVEGLYISSTGVYC